MCCVCDGHCFHVGPHDYCSAHLPGQPANVPSMFWPISYPGVPMLSPAVEAALLDLIKHIKDSIKLCGHGCIETTCAACATAWMGYPR